MDRVVVRTQQQAKAEEAMVMSLFGTERRDWAFYKPSPSPRFEHLVFREAMMMALFERDRHDWAPSRLELVKAA